MDLLEEQKQGCYRASGSDGQAHGKEPEDMEVPAQEEEHQQDQHDRGYRYDGDLSLGTTCALVAVEGKTAAAYLGSVIG